MTQEEKRRLLTEISDRQLVQEMKGRRLRLGFAPGGYRLGWGAEHRDGFCCDCGEALVQDPAVDPAVRTDRNFCARCGGYRLGRLVVRQAIVQAPDPPTCLRPGCVLRYLKDSLTYALVASYHSRRVHFAETHRGKSILERYRTGEPGPKTLWQALHANIKLTCPVCRRYNVDPLLFAGRGAR